MKINLKKEKSSEDMLKEIIESGVNNIILKTKVKPNKKELEIITNLYKIFYIKILEMVIIGKEDITGDYAVNKLIKEETEEASKYGEKSLAAFKDIEPLVTYIAQSAWMDFEKHYNITNVPKKEENGWNKSNEPK